MPGVLLCINSCCELAYQMIRNHVVTITYKAQGVRRGCNWWLMVVGSIEEEMQGGKEWSGTNSKLRRDTLIPGSSQPMSSWVRGLEL